MKETYTAIYNFFIFFKISCPLMSAVFVVIWFVQFLNANLFAKLCDYVDPFLYWANKIDDFMFSFDGKVQTDMTCIMVAICFILLHYVFGFIAARVVDLYLVEKKRDINKKSFDEKNVNIDIKRDLKKELLKYKKFAILLEMLLEPSFVTEQNRDEEIKNLKNEFYTNLLKKLSDNFKTTQGKRLDEYLVLANEEFDKFDDFITQIIQEIKIFGEKNLEINVSTEFLISLDATKEDVSIEEKQEFLAKINSFKHTNKVIATSAFKTKYETNANKKFFFDPIGVLRFFENDNKHSDFDLFNLKKIKKI